jgi:hypothetical protein
MRRQAVTKNFPTDQSPENESSDYVGPASGMEVQASVLQHTDPALARAGQFTPEGPTAALRIVISPTPSRKKWTARLNDRVLCVSAWPFVMSARLLLAEGYPADAFIEVWRPNTDEWAMRGRLGAVAATIIDGETASRYAKNGCPGRFSGTAATGRAR